MHGYFVYGCYFSPKNYFPAKLGVACKHNELAAYFEEENGASTAAQSNPQQYSVPLYDVIVSAPFGAACENEMPRVATNEASLDSMGLDYARCTVAREWFHFPFIYIINLSTNEENKIFCNEKTR